MNIIQKTIALFAVTTFIFTAQVKAAPIDPHINSALQGTVNAYISALTAGDVTAAKDLFDDHVKFDISGTKKSFSFSKKEMLRFMDQTKGVVQQNCSTSVEWVDDQENVAIAKVTQKYPTFSRVNYVTLTAIGPGWKITHVQSSFN